MGGKHSKDAGPSSSRSRSRRRSKAAAPKHAITEAGYNFFTDRFQTLDQVRQALRKSGVEGFNLVIGVDFTKSNTWNGQNTNQGLSLHAVMPPGELNPYEQVIHILSETMAGLMRSDQIRCFGFGDAVTKDHGVFSFYDDDRPCQGFDNVLKRYRELVQCTKLMGPTSFAPIIRRAIDVVNQTREYHILVIIADGQVTQSENPNLNSMSPQEVDTMNALMEACHFPLSIIMVGVGDGPWDQMNYFDDKIPMRPFDNFQFVDYHEVTRKSPHLPPHEIQASFAKHALMEIPDQYSYIKASGVIKFKPGKVVRQPPYPPPRMAPSPLPSPEDRKSSVALSSSTSPRLPSLQSRLAADPNNPLHS